MRLNKPFFFVCFLVGSESEGWKEGSKQTLNFVGVANYFSIFLDTFDLMGDYF